MNRARPSREADPGQTVAHPAQTCEEVLALLSAYLDLELPPEDCLHIQQHIEGCPPCDEFADSLRKAVELCRAYAPGPPPERLSRDARAALEAAWRTALAARGRI